MVVALVGSVLCFAPVGVVVVALVGSVSCFAPVGVVAVSLPVDAVVGCFVDYCSNLSD